MRNTGRLTGQQIIQAIRTAHVTVATDATELSAAKKVPRNVVIQNNHVSAIVYLCLTGDAHLSLRFTSGGTTAIEVGDTIVGETSEATAVVTAIDLDSGAWAVTGDAAGVLSIDTVVGTFEAEKLKVGGNTDLADIAAGAYTKGMFVIFPGGGSFEILGSRNAVSAIASASNEAVAVSEGR